MPAFFAFAARSLPTSAACSVFLPLNFFRCSQLAAASVRPSRSFTSCASIPRFERNTTRRGRSAVPLILPRTRRWRRARASGLVRVGIPLRPLSDLAAHVLALVADALALVGLGRAHRPHLGRGLADLLLVDALHDDLRRHGHLEGDPGPRLDDDGVREADVELERGSAERGAVADALDLEALLEALGHALDHVRDERAREPVERAIVAPLGRSRDDELAVPLLDLHTGRH